jgi:hypothetical protein
MTNNGRWHDNVAPQRQRRGRRPTSVVLGGDLRTGKPSGEQRRRPTWSNPSSGVMNLPVRTMAMWWHGDVDRGGEVATSDRPGQNYHAYKGVQHRASGVARGARYPAVSDRQAWAEETVTDKWARSYLISNQILNAEN